MSESKRFEELNCSVHVWIFFQKGGGVKGIYTRLLSGQTGKQSISVGLNCLQVKTGDQRSPVVRSSSFIVKSVQSSPKGQIIP